MAAYFGNTLLPDPSEMGSAWERPEQIDMDGAEMFMPANKLIVGNVLGKLITPGSAVLEVGAGTGHLGRIIPASLRGNYLQTDRTPQYAVLSKAHNGLLSAVADINTLSEDIGDQAPFDAVVAMDVLDVLPNQETAAEQIAGVLRGGGVFVHFHNRRPSMTTLSRPFRQFGHVFPTLDSDGGLRRFRVVPQQAYAAARDTLDNPKASDVLASRPDLLDWLSGHEYQAFLGVAHDVDQHFNGTGEETLSFVKLMHQAAKRALEGAGMTVRFTGTAAGEKPASRKRVASLLEREGMNSAVNVISKQAGAILFDHTDLKNGQVLIRNELSVLIAENTAAAEV